MTNNFKLPEWNDMEMQLRFGFLLPFSFNFLWPELAACALDAKVTTGKDAEVATQTSSS